MFFLFTLSLLDPGVPVLKNIPGCFFVPFLPIMAAWWCIRTFADLAWKLFRFFMAFAWGHKILTLAFAVNVVITIVVLICSVALVGELHDPNNTLNFHEGTGGVLHYLVVGAANFLYGLYEAIGFFCQEAPKLVNEWTRPANGFWGNLLATVAAIVVAAVQTFLFWGMHFITLDSIIGCAVLALVIIVLAGGGSAITGIIAAAIKAALGGGGGGGHKAGGGHSAAAHH